jgi:transposase
MAKLGRAQVMVAREMVERGVSVRQVARQLGVAESGLRYRLGRAVDAADGRTERPAVCDGWDARVDAVLTRFDDRRVVSQGMGHCRAHTLHDVLRREYGFSGSYQAVRRYLRRRFGTSPVQAVRRVETPPGVQAQHDWFEFDATVAGARQHLYGLIGTLSHSRATFVWVSPTTTQLAWQAGHLALFQRYGGVPLWVRVDNLKTAVAAGAGPTAVLNRTFVAFADLCRFAIDPCRAATGADKGKVERQVRAERVTFADLWLADWPTLEHFQAALDARAVEVQTQRRCPATGTSIADALVAERAVLQAVPAIGEPFDCVVARRVSRDCLVSFEGRRYSVPFAWVGRVVEVRGTARHVVVLGAGSEVARHPRQTAHRLVIESTHYDGAATPTVQAPTPLGHRARRQMAEVPGVPSAIGRSLAAYVALVEEACQ